MAPSGQLRQPQLLVKELSHCVSLQGCPKIFLLLSSGLKGEWMDSDPSFGEMNRKAGSCCPTYTAMGWGASPPAAWEPEAFLLHLGKICSQHPHWSLLQLLTEVGEPEEGKAGPMSPWPPTVSYDQTNSGSVAPVLQTWAAGHAFVTTRDHPDSKRPFHPTTLPRVFPQCHMLSLLAWLLVSTLKNIQPHRSTLIQAMTTALFY